MNKLVLVLLLVSSSVFAREIPYTYESLNKLCEVYKGYKTFKRCTPLNKVSEFSYEFFDDYVVVKYNKSKFKLSYGKRLAFLNQDLVVLKSDQVIRDNEIVTARNDEYVDYCNGEYKILNEFEICFNDQLKEYGVVSQSNYYQILYFDLKEFTSIIEKILVLEPINISPLLELNIDRKKLRLIISHNLEKARLRSIKYQNVEIYKETKTYLKSLLKKLN